MLELSLKEEKAGQMQPEQRTSRKLQLPPDGNSFYVSRLDKYGFWVFITIVVYWKPVAAIVLLTLTAWWWAW